MTREIRDLALPLASDEARCLRVGDMVTVSGRVFTGRSRFHIRAVHERILPPLDFAATNCFFHVGPVMRRASDGWQVISVEPTSSIRFERHGAAVVRELGLRTLIGKTTMGPATVRALHDVGGVFLSKVGVCGNQLAEQITRVCAVHFLEDLGKTEATWVLEVARFGPFFVAIDAHGNSYFEELAVATRQRLPSVLGRLGVPSGYAYTNVNASGQNGACTDD